MKPVTPFDNFPSFGNAGARQAPGDAKYAQGFLAADTLPAEWANYFFHGSTKGISDLNTAVRSIWLELSSVLTAYNITADVSQTDQLYKAIEKRISSLYPVGTIYQNADSNKNPGDSDMLGFGTWEPITDKFLAARGSTNIGASGGAWTVTLSANNIPRHRHQVNNHTHGMQHYHDTDILHNHGITDTGHQHGIQHGYIGGSSVATQYNAGGGSQWMNFYPEGTLSIVGYTGISINNVAETQRYKRSGGSINANATARTDTDGASPYTDYQYAESPTAISITPTYVGVYTWKRTA